MEIQYTLEALFIFGLGNWIALIIYTSCCKWAEKGQAGGGVGRLGEGLPTNWDHSKRLKCSKLD